VNLGRVRGTVVATVKDDSLHGQRLLLVQPLTWDGRETGSPIVATDTVRSGAAELVIFVRGKEAAFAHRPEEVVSDAAVVGVVEPQHVTSEPR